MKKLGLFTSFDFNAFSKGKQFMCTGVQPWKDHDTGRVLGTKVEVVIVKDMTNYGAEKDGAKISNLFEKLIFKVPSSIDVPINAEVVPVNPVATVYGEFRNQLSIIADGVQVVTK